MLWFSEAVMRSRCLLLLVMLALAGCQGKKTEPQPIPVAATNNERAPVTTEVVGVIKGKPFTPDQVGYEDRKLSFRKGKDVFADMEISFELPASAGAQLAGKEWKFGGDHLDHPAVHVSMKEGQVLPSAEFVWPKDYMMTLTFTKQTGASLEGTIDLRCSKPGNTRLAGRFTAAVTRTAAEEPVADDAPYVRGKILIVGKWQKTSLAAGFVSLGKDGKRTSNMAGTSLTQGGSEWATSTTFKPQLTSTFNHATNGPGFKHVKMTPGDYLVYARWGDVVAAWKKVTVKANDQLTVDLTVDPAKMGSVVVTLPEEEAKDRSEPNLYLVPLEFDRSDLWIRAAFRPAVVKPGSTTVTINGVPAGKYVALRGKSEADVDVTAGKEAACTLVRNEPKKN
jgi:hypothetical protein